MIAPQSPSLQVFVTIERVLRADMASEHFSSIATIRSARPISACSATCRTTSHISIVRREKVIEQVKARMRGKKPESDE
jgi:hypothetical protein